MQDRNRKWPEMNSWDDKDHFDTHKALYCWIKQDLDIPRLVTSLWRHRSWPDSEKSSAPYKFTIDYDKKRIRSISLTSFEKKIQNCPSLKKKSTLAEKIFERAERRSDLNRAYTKLIRAVYSGIDKCSDQSEKTPPEVIRFQNFHNCFAVLSSLKIEVDKL